MGKLSKIFWKKKYKIFSVKYLGWKGHSALGDMLWLECSRRSGDPRAQRGGPAVFIKKKPGRTWEKPGSPSPNQCLGIFLSFSLFSYSEIQCHLLFHFYSITLIWVSSSFTWVIYYNTQATWLSSLPFSISRNWNIFLKYKSSCISNSDRTPTCWHAHTYILSSSVAPLLLIVHRAPTAVFLHLLLCSDTPEGSGMLCTDGWGGRERENKRESVH